MSGQHPSKSRPHTEPPLADPVTVEVYRHLFASIADEMGEVLRRTACSPNIKERRDYSSARRHSVRALGPCSINCRATSTATSIASRGSSGRFRRASLSGRVEDVAGACST